MTDSTITTAKFFISNIRRHIERDDCEHCKQVLKGKVRDSATSPEPTDDAQLAKSGATNVFQE